MRNKSILLLIVGFVFMATPAFCADRWEVAVLFLGSAEPDDFQVAVDRNIQELIQLKPTQSLRLSIFREFPNREVTLFRSSTSKKEDQISELFFRAPEPAPVVTGHLESRPRVASKHPVVGQPEKLEQFFKDAFNSTNAKRMLIVYGHGFAFDGFRNASVREVHENLSTSLPARTASYPLDLFWMDSCFMGNLETLFELRKIAPYIVASEESEFDSGSPYEFLADLQDGTSSPLETATKLAQGYLESYSVLKDGSQKNSVVRSSATIAVIDTSKLEDAVVRIAPLADALNKLTEGEKKALARNLKKGAMERKGLVDFGTLLLAIRKQEKLNLELRAIARDLTAAFDLNHENRVRTNPRIRVSPPNPGQLLVFGYENWSRGFEGDSTLSADNFPRNQRPTSYAAGPENRKWPARMVNIRLDLSPFSVGLKTFNYYFADAVTLNPTTEPKELTREKDLFWFSSAKATNPIPFSGYTQGIGSTGEVYTGVSVLNPLLGQSISMEYQELEFSKQTGWGKN